MFRIKSSNKQSCLLVVGIKSLASSFFCNPFFHISLSQYRSCLHLQKTSLYHCPIIHEIAPHFCSKNCLKLLEKHIPLKPMRALGELKGVCSTWFWTGFWAATGRASSSCPSAPSKLLCVLMAMLLVQKKFTQEKGSLWNLHSTTKAFNS